MNAPRHAFAAQVPAHAGAPLLVRWADVVPAPWRNGRGTTRTLLERRLPDGRGWRVSVADITADAPFSAYPGVQRWFAVLAGEGVLLHLGGDWRPVLRGATPLCFDGDSAPECTLLAGATRDLNLMLQRCSGDMQRVVGNVWEPGVCTACGVFAVQASTLATDDAPALQIPALSLLWFDDPPRRLSFQSAMDAPVYALRVDEALR